MCYDEINGVIDAMDSKLSLNRRLYEIRWHGRGGQGAITAAKLLAQAAYLDGYQGVTAAPSFGAERRGAPVSASTRIAPEPILVVSQVEEPDVVVVLDHSLLRISDVTSGLREGGWLVVNSRQSPNELKVKGHFNIATADATSVCRELGLVVTGLIVVNTAILGAFVRATEIVNLANLEEVVRGKFPRDAMEKNLSAIKRTYEITELYRI
jgi:pyruvate ferredoxin oxidoreductase gamma subunit